MVSSSEPEIGEPSSNSTRILYIDFRANTLEKRYEPTSPDIGKISCRIIISMSSNMSNNVTSRSIYFRCYISSGRKGS